MHNKRVVWRVTISIGYAEISSVVENKMKVVDMIEDFMMVFGNDNNLGIVIVPELAGAEEQEEKA